MSEDIIFREAVLADAQALFEAHQDSVQNLCSEAYTETQLALWFEDRTPHIYRPAIEARQLWLAESGSRVLGFVGFVPGEVTVLFVRKEAAGAGLGSRLFTLGLERASSGYVGPLSVVATMNSQPFYRKHGFFPIEEDALVRGKAGIQIKVVKMQRLLAAQA